jgi:hypothetical protein
MVAIWKETDKHFYYGETSLFDPNVWHGKGIAFFKETKSLYECWFVNNKRQGRGRFISNNKHIYLGDWFEGYRHG